MDVDERFDWEGRSIAWGRAGSGPPVVFCHGTPFSSRVWSRYAEALSADFTVHLWDMPGYGESSKHPDHAVDFGAQAKAFAALLEHWGLDRPHVVAHDFGGAVSLRATLAEQAAYASLMLVDVVAIPPSGSPFFQFVKRHPTTLDELPPYIHEAILRAYVSAASHRGLREHELAELVAPWRTEAGQPAFYRQIAQYDEKFLAENERGLGDLSIPVKVLWGRDDAWIPPATGRRLAKLIPGASYAEVPDAGHLMQYDAPVALATALRDWLYF
ncbi:MAG TPA: alpha/beta hydrolase [Kribbella sp.]|jgi:pimeloyl-ACP methyl ester carboxylesterase